jgi:hypothetical protein
MWKKKCITYENSLYIFIHWICVKMFIIYKITSKSVTVHCSVNARYVKYWYQWNGSIQTFLSDEYLPSYEPRMLSTLRMHFRAPELYIKLSPSSIFPCLFFTQQNSHWITGALNETVYRNTGRWTRVATRSTDGVLRGVWGGMIVLNFIYTLFFFRIYGLLCGQLCFQVTTTYKISLAARQDKINKSKPFAILIIRIIYSADLCTMIRVY